MLLVTESAPPEKRGWYGAYAQAGAPIGVILANLAFLGVSGGLSEEAFMDWGWRIPFIASILLILVSLYVQLNLEDTEAFKKLAASQDKDSSTDKVVERSPIIEVLSRHPGRIFLAAGAFLSIQVTFYILIAFIMALWCQLTLSYAVSKYDARLCTYCGSYNDSRSVLGRWVIGQNRT
jgi:MFS family permease